MLRERDSAALDCENLTEEIEDLGRSLQRELQSRLTVLIAYLLKRQFQPGLREASTWRAAIRKQRRELSYLLDQSPSLKPKIATLWDKVYRTAVEDAADEMRTDKESFPVACPFTRDQVLDLGFLPE
jgi:hypothetical protein